MMYNVFGLLAVAVLSKLALALPEPVVTPAAVYKRSCYSYTVTTPYTGPVYCPMIPASCPPHPDCVLLEEKTLTVPCANKKCPVTPTVTVTGAGVCPTCQTGCATDVVTVTQTASCA